MNHLAANLGPAAGADKAVRKSNDKPERKVEKTGIINRPDDH